MTEANFYKKYANLPLEKRNQPLLIGASWVTFDYLHSKLNHLTDIRRDNNEEIKELLEMVEKLL